MSLEKLKIDKAPAAFVDFANKHNALTALVAMLKGIKGIKVVVTEKSIVIGVDPATPLAGSLNGSLSYSDASITITIGADGIKLTNIASGDYAKIYPTGAIGITDISSGNELLLSPSDMFYGNIDMKEFTACDSGTPKFVRLLASDFYT